jgi:two-component system sensor histidine kinase UhpB
MPAVANSEHERASAQGSPRRGTWSIAHLRAMLRQVNAAARRLPTFEKALIANSLVILLDTAAGWWITQHNPETYHYLIDTAFILIAALVGMLVNFALLRAVFAPLRGVLATIHRVDDGDLDARVAVEDADADAAALARTFNAMLDHLEAARNETTARVLRGQEAERRRLALELHDQTGQSLTALTLHAEAIVQCLNGEQAQRVTQARVMAERLGALAQQTLVEVQNLSRQLRPQALDDLGLMAALRWLAEDSRRRLGVEVRVVGQSDLADDHRLPDELETALFRVVQESVTNAVRHGHARQVVVRVTRRRRSIALLVADDGAGFGSAGKSTSGPQGVDSGLGINGMRERVRLLGGRLSLRSIHGLGCVVGVSVPLPEVAHDTAMGQLALSQTFA